MKLLTFVMMVVTATLFPTFAMAQNASTNDVPSAVVATSARDHLAPSPVTYSNETTDYSAYNYGESSSVSRSNSGFSMIFDIGGTIAFYERLDTGYRKFDTKAAGVQANIGFGYKYENFGIYFEGMLRGAFGLKDQYSSHCPGPTQESWTYCYDYKKHKKGEWDGYAGGVGLVMLGFIPLSDTITLTAGGGFLIYLGKPVGESIKSLETTGAVKLELGLNFAVTDTLTAGFKISEEGWLDVHRSLTPSFTMIYNY